MAFAATPAMPVDTDAEAAQTWVPQDAPFFVAVAVDSSKTYWGDSDLDAADPAAPAEPCIARVIEWWTNEYKLAERLANWRVPDLTLRSDIAEHFPVVLLSLPASVDGRERFMVKFDDRVDEWATTRAMSNDENTEYAEWVQTRLIFALRQYSYKYHLESDGAAEGSDHVAIFVMAHPSAAARRARAAIPTLCSFPVTWEQDRADHTRHLVKIHQRRMVDEGIDAIELADHMMVAMTACEDCTFELIPTVGSPYLFTVTIPTAPAPKRYVCACVHCGGVPAPVSAAPAPRPATPAVPAAPAAPAAAPVPRPAAPAPAAAAAAAALAPRRKAFIPILLSKKIQWKQDDLDRSVYRIKSDIRTDRGYRKLTADEQTEIIRELRTCTDCRVESCSGDRMFFCIITKEL